VTGADLAKIAILLDTAARAGLTVTTSHDGMIYRVTMASATGQVSEGFASTLNAAMRMAAEPWKLTGC
jgi:hypothetical protein